MGRVKFVSRWLTGAVALSLAFSAYAAYPSCPISKSAPFPFQSPTSHDVLTVSISAGDCFDAILEISIRDSNGFVLYEYREKFKKHTATAWDDPGLPEVAVQFVEDVFQGTKATLGQFPIPEGTATGPSYVVEVSKGDLKRLQAISQPVFRHLTHYEEGRYVVFDPALRKAVVAVRWAD